LKQGGLRRCRPKKGWRHVIVLGTAESGVVKGENHVNGVLLRSGRAKALVRCRPLTTVGGGFHTATVRVGSVPGQAGRVRIPLDGVIA